MSEASAETLASFAAILKRNEPLAPYTHLRIGGPAEALAQPESVDELGALVRKCLERRLPLHVLGNGCNLLVRDEGVAGVVVRLCTPAFTAIEVEGRRVQAGAGAALSAVISKAAHHGLAGLETLVGIPGTVGGALRRPVAAHATNLVSLVRTLDYVDNGGQRRRAGREEIDSGTLLVDASVLVSTELELEADAADAIVKRMQKAWIQRKAEQPFSFQAAARAFKDPRGQTAGSLIEQAGLGGTRVGNAQLSERNPNYLIAHAGATSKDVLRLLDLVRSQVRERTGIDLELELTVW